MLRLTSATLALFVLANFSGVTAYSTGSSATSDASYNTLRGGVSLGNSAHMWTFGAEGVHIYQPDGTSVKSIGPDTVCKNATYGDSFRTRCDFYDVVSDGKKYIWATVARGVPKVDVFKLDTGAYVGSFDTCGSPRQLDYHPVREEVWVHCSTYEDMENSHMDVFSTLSPSVNIMSNVTLHDNTAMRSYGQFVTDPSLDDTGYATVYGTGLMSKVDLSSRIVKETVSFGEGVDNFYGIYEMAYSPANQHIFTRSGVCCSCGFEGADLLKCDRYGSSNITIRGETVEGQCGRHCEGGPTDTIGIYEFDTKTDTVVGNHMNVGSGAADSMFTSPDGERIVMFGLNSGKTVNILKAGANGVKSTLEHEIKLDFNITNIDEINVFEDYAFVKHQELDLFVLSSSNEHKVAIVDLAESPPTVSYVVFKPTPVQAGRLRTRQVEWAYGTNYVWVSGRQEGEIYVIDVAQKTLVTTIANDDTRKLLSVVNFEGMESMQISANLAEQRNGDEDDDKDETSRALSITAIVLSIVAIVAVLVNVMAMKSSGPASAPATQRAADEESLPSVK